MAGNSRDEGEFVWDEESRLYFHARTGFYHDPTAGWYYSSMDGNYYTFEDGNYVLLQADMVAEHRTGDSLHKIPGGDYLHVHSDRNYEDVSTARDNFADCQKEKIVADETNSGCDDTSLQASGCLVQPPSEWLEDTLIELYLSGYSNPRDCSENQIAGSEVNEDNDGPCELEEGEWIPDDLIVRADSSGHISNTGLTEPVEMGASLDEDHWHSQYGQVTSSRQDMALDVPVIDLWDWTIVRDRDDRISKLVGRLVKPSAKPHPSMSGRGQYFKTAPVRQACEDLIRVKTGKIYRLRSPSAKYLATVNFYDSSNPTKDWGFPILSSIQRCKHSKSNHSVVELDGSSTSQKDVNLQYRDRAAERRVLHQGFGIGPGQKEIIPKGEEPSFPGSGPVNNEIASSETTFGEGSYARKVLQSMGWHEGEGLGSTVKGIVEPIKAIGNVGSAGLGWPQGRKEHH